MSGPLLLTVIAALFIALGLLCAIRIALPRPPARDPFSIPFGDMPGFSAEQLREIGRRGLDNAASDPLRRSFIEGPAGRRRYAGGDGLSDPLRPNRRPHFLPTPPARVATGGGDAVS